MTIYTNLGDFADFRSLELEMKHTGNSEVHIDKVDYWGITLGTGSYTLQEIQEVINNQ